MRSRGRVFVLSLLLITSFILTASSFAIPTSRPYATTCPTGPAGFSKLNDFGEALETASRVQEGGSR